MPGDATKVDEVTHEGNRSRTRLWVGMILLGALVALLAAVAVACGEAVTETTVPPATDATTTAVTPASTSTTLADVSPPSGADAVIAYLEYAVTGRRPLSEDPRFSFVWPSGQEWGLWAGNVEVFPAGTDRLPPQFYQEPPDDGLPQLPDFITSMATFLDPGSIPKPLWVFAEGEDLSAAGPAMVAAKESGRPILVVGAGLTAVAEVLDVTPDMEQSSGAAVTARTAVGYLPWREQSLVEGMILPVDYYVQPPKDPAPIPTPTEVYDSLAVATLLADSPPLSEEEGLARALESGMYMGFWAGNVEVIPENSVHLPDFFYSGPTPCPAPRTDQPSAFVDPGAINTPLWVMGDEVDPLDYTERIRAAMAEDRPIMFYATTEEVAEETLGIEDPASGTSSAPMSLQIRPWYPWQNGGGLGVFTWGDAEAGEELSSPNWVFQMLAMVTLEGPRGVENESRPQPLSREEVADLLTTGYRGIDMVLALPSALPDGFVVAGSYRPSAAPGGASAGSATPPVVDNPNLSPTWWGVRYTRDPEAREASFWLLAGLPTAPRGADWRQVGETAALGPVSVAAWGDVTWVRVGNGEPALYLVGPVAMEEAMVETARSMTVDPTAPQPTHAWNGDQAGDSGNYHCEGNLLANYLGGTFPLPAQVWFADIIVYGVVTDVLPGRWNSPDGTQWQGPNDASTASVIYRTFYVEPIEILKGQPAFGAPVAFMAEGGIKGEISGPVNTGDTVLVFARYEPNAYGGT